MGKWKVKRTEAIIIIEMSEKLAEREAYFYLEVNGHHNIIQTLGTIENTSNLTIFIQDFAPLSDLASVLMENDPKITLTMLMEMFLQITDAMCYVANKRIVHGDLGCRNVLVFELDLSQHKRNLVKITDFGLARSLNELIVVHNSSIIPKRFCAPEILQNHNSFSFYTQKSDVYSMGVLMWEALSKSEIPYSHIDDDDKVVLCKLGNEKLIRPSVCDHELWQFIESCLEYEPEWRPTFQDIEKKLGSMNISEDSNVLRSVSSDK